MNFNHVFAGARDLTVVHRCRGQAAIQIKHDTPTAKVLAFWVLGPNLQAHHGVPAKSLHVCVFGVSEKSKAQLDCLAMASSVIKSRRALRLRFGTLCFGTGHNSVLGCSCNRCAHGWNGFWFYQIALCLVAPLPKPLPRYWTRLLGMLLCFMCPWIF